MNKKGIAYIGLFLAGLLVLTSATLLFSTQTNSPTGFVSYNSLSQKCKQYFGDATCDDSAQDCGDYYNKDESTQECDECDTVNAAGKRGFECPKSKPSIIYGGDADENGGINYYDCGIIQDNVKKGSFGEFNGDANCDGFINQDDVGYCMKITATPKAADACELPRCVDSDGGNAIFKKGQLTMIYKNAKTTPSLDYCMGDTLTEYYCQSNKELAYKSHNCPAGCFDGACIQPGSSTTVPSSPQNTVPPPASTVTTYGQISTVGNGDVNEDGVVDVFDMLFVASRFGVQQGVSSEYDVSFDIVLDGIVNVGDIVAVGTKLEDYGKTEEVLDIVNVGARFGSKQGDSEYLSTADKDGDGQIDMADLVEVISNYQKKSVAYPSTTTTMPYYSEQYQTYKKGDANTDGLVNEEDLLIIALKFGSFKGNDQYLVNADTDNNGIIDVIDLVYVAGQIESLEKIAEAKKIVLITEKFGSNKGDSAYQMDADENSDGGVDVADLGIAIKKFKQAKEAQYPPPPTSTVYYVQPEFSPVTPTTIVTTSYGIKKVFARTDVNLDGETDAIDLLFVTKLIGITKDDAGYRVEADTDANGIIDFIDATRVALAIKRCTGKEKFSYSPQEPSGYIPTSSTIQPQKSGSCANSDGTNSCGGQSKTEGASCYCDDTCAQYGDCCADKKEICG